MIERAGQTYREIRPADFTPRAGDKGRERILGASICGEPRRAASRLSFDARRFRTSGVACFVRLTSGKEEREREEKKRFSRISQRRARNVIQFQSARFAQKYTRTPDILFRRPFRIAFKRASANGYFKFEMFSGLNLKSFPPDAAYASAIGRKKHGVFGENKKRERERERERGRKKEKKRA